jgi:hypothetical protein
MPHYMPSRNLSTALTSLLGMQSFHFRESRHLPELWCSQHAARGGPDAAAANSAGGRRCARRNRLSLSLAIQDEAARIKPLQVA